MYFALKDISVFNLRYMFQGLALLSSLALGYVFKQRPWLVQPCATSGI